MSDRGSHFVTVASSVSSRIDLLIMAVAQHGFNSDEAKAARAEVEVAVLSHCDDVWRFAYDAGKGAPP